MSKKEIVLNIVNSIKKGVGKRNVLFSHYRGIHVDAKSGGNIKFDSSDFDTHYLGFISQGQHRMIENILSDCPQTNDGGYRIHTESKRKGIARRAILVMVLIKIRNTVYLSFLFIFILVSLLVLSFGANIVSELAGSLF
ncbi:hypothetical protein [Natrinema versiforme]|uniref:hypothetical protein n=1 Tax=Natrinema versiforme TaxID=88724 RepID=UPI001267E0D2|nr:hypothetical protein [Natrinema versiforme]